MGWEYGMKTTNPSILPELVECLAGAIHVPDKFRIERYENGFESVSYRWRACCRLVETDGAGDGSSPI
ncbi:hypothetical protein SAMN04487969_111158 [Paenibacillus algorifonticola]|uniref:Uncharacterized protein n=1 Tax=Paenibacillus algorifonticola TaxID=684063 RepID=A0A1I2F9X2_9BACL|nr:hypothetical protein SAMN04487969_111158 [Paenibacillus algorifonticola]